MDQYNNNINENQGMGSENNVNTQQNVIPQEPQINQADLYAPYNQPQNENVQESVPQQNAYAQNNQNGYYQPQQSYSGNNFQQQYNQYNSGNDYQQQYSQCSQNGNYGISNNQQYYQNGQNDGSYMYNQPQQYNDAYYNQQYPSYNLQEKPKGFAIASLILGIGSLFTCCCTGFISFFAGVAGLILGIVSLKRNEDGKGMAIAGIVLSSIGIVLSIFIIILFIAGMAEGFSDTNPYDYYYFN